MLVEVNFRGPEKKRQSIFIAVSDSGYDMVALSLYKPNKGLKTNYCTVNNSDA